MTRLLRAGLGMGFAILLGAAGHCAGERAPRSNTAGPPAPSSTPMPDSVPPVRADPPSDLFAASVRPILTSHCAPCHEPGGVMYGRMPFDRGEVVAAHSTGVLKRLNAAEEREAVETWLKTLAEP